MRLGPYLATGLALMLIAGPAQATTPDRYTIARACTTPTPERPVCLADRTWTAAEAVQRIGLLDVLAFAEGPTLTVMARRAEGPISLCCAIAAPMTRVAGSDVWTVSVNVFALDRAIFDIQISPALPLAPGFAYYGVHALRPPVSEPLTGQLVVEMLPSKALGVTRKLTLYLPPHYDKARRYPVLYMADGFAVPVFASAIEAAILSGQIRPLIVVGLWPGEGGERSREYLPGRSAPRYAEHADFVLNEVLPLVEQKYAPATRPEDRLIAGFSDGAAWALSTGLKHKDVFGGIVALSFGWKPAAAGIDAPDRPRLFLASGLLEPDFNATTQDAFRRAGYGNNPVIFDGYTSGHELPAWRSMLLDALREFLPGEPKKP